MDSLKIDSNSKVGKGEQDVEDNLPLITKTDPRFFTTVQSIILQSSEARNIVFLID